MAALPPQPDPIAQPNGRLTVDAREYPWRALGRLNIGGVDFCSGALVGPETVLVRAHCLYDKRWQRWRPEIELHFVAGYQRDRFLADSPVREYRVPEGYDPSRMQSLGSLTHNWALVRLAKPIGNDVGWLGVAWGRTAPGNAPPMLAGYRRDRAHVLTLFYGCAVRRGPNCTPLADENGFLRLRSPQSGLSVAGEHYFPSQGAMIEGLGAEGVFANALGSEARPPDDSFLVTTASHTVAVLLWQLGRLERGPEESSLDEVERAIRAFERERGMPETGRSSIGLFSRLIEEARRSAG